MALGFGATHGTGTSDQVRSPYTTIGNSGRTYSIWLKYLSAGGNSAGRAYEKGSGEEVLYVSTSLQRFVIQKLFTDGSSEYHASGLPTSNTWVHVAIISNWSAHAVPSVYINGASVTVSVITSRSTAPTTGTGNYTIGGRLGSTSLNFDGTLAEFSLWNRQLAAAEVVELFKGVSAARLHRDLVSYHPLIRAGHDWRNASTGTATTVGTVAQPHPRIYYRSAELWLRGGGGALTFSDTFSATVVLDMSLSETMSIAAPTLFDTVMLGDNYAYLGSPFDTGFSSAFGSGAPLPTFFSDTFSSDVVVDFTTSSVLLFGFGETAEDSLVLDALYDATLSFSADLAESVTLGDTVTTGETVENNTVAETLVVGATFAAETLWSPVTQSFSFSWSVV